MTKTPQDAATVWENRLKATFGDPVWQICWHCCCFSTVWLRLLCRLVLIQWLWTCHCYPLQSHQLPTQHISRNRKLPAPKVHLANCYCHPFSTKVSISLSFSSCILLHFPLLRLMIARTYLKHYQDIIRKNRRNLVYLAVLLNVIENFSLLGLSLFTSAIDYGKSFLLLLLHKLVFFFPPRNPS